MSITSSGHKIFVDKLKTEFENVWDHIDLPSSPGLLYEPISYSISGRGKRIRPLLVLLSADATGGNWKAALPIAVSVEMLHLFTLIHDDIMDNDTHRRGMPTVHTKWDQNIGILSGDALIGMALQTLTTARANNIASLVSVFASGMLTVCEGQALDYDFEKRDDVSLEEYETMVGKKTGALIGMSMAMGAIFSKAPDSTRDSLKRFGIEIGTAFQMQDDLLEMISDEKTMGKSLTSDIESFKKTYPILKALSVFSKEKSSELIYALRNSRQPGLLKREMLHSFEKHGILDACRHDIRLRFRHALSLLSCLPENKRQGLEWISNSIMTRKH